MPIDDLALLGQLGLPTVGVRRVLHRNGRKAASIPILGLLFHVLVYEPLLDTSTRSAWTRRPQISKVLPETG